MYNSKEKGEIKELLLVLVVLGPPKAGFYCWSYLCINLRELAVSVHQMTELSLKEVPIKYIEGNTKLVLHQPW